MVDEIRPLEQVLCQYPCYNTSHKCDGLMIVTSTRLLWKLQNTFPIQIIRSYGAGKALKTQRKDSGKGYWVI